VLSSWNEIGEGVPGRRDDPEDVTGGGAVGLVAEDRAAAGDADAPVRWHDGVRRSGQPEARGRSDHGAREYELPKH